MTTSISRVRHSVDAWARALLFIILFLYFGIYLVESLQWRMTHDSPLVFYSSFLIDRFHVIPYLDLFTDTFPGTLLVHMAVGRLIGYSDSLGFRLVDLTSLALLSAITWTLMRRWGRWTAGGAILLFGLAYLHEGPALSFQRDYLGLIPVTLAVLVSVASPRKGLSPVVRSLLVGLLFGLAATVKPHLALGGPVVLLYILAVEFEGGSASIWPRQLLQTGVSALIGLAFPLAMVLWWLRHRGGGPAYLDMLRHHLPLYLSLSGEHRVIIGHVNRLLYNMQQFGRVGGFSAWLLPAGLGINTQIYQQRLPRTQRRQVWLLAALAGVYSIYAWMGAKFWPYHWIPCLFFLILLASLLLSSSNSSDRTGGVFRFGLAALALTAFLTLAPTNEFYRQLHGLPPRPPEEGRADAIAAALIPKLRPGDTVQVLDWTGGGNHALLIAKVQMATPFFEDYLFYHHVSDPYIQNLRSRFITRLQEVKPRFIVDVTVKPRVSGPDTTTLFSALRQFIDDHYRVTVVGEGWQIYEWQQ